ncbi:DNA mismatch repair protein msh6 [Stylosanthes scabra]|uniref:DNA mismatch repair protein msh6 n=1 Tax=Stylosanthes scabra TaxID=79078 RepID=A0ABU6T2H9_9FABA|nr:DNA mismatch repair protein msh6 [Stylosanthes scabra]
MQVWDELTRVREGVGVPTLFGGDFNEIVDSSETKGCVSLSQSSILFREWMDFLELVDLELVGRKYTGFKEVVKEEWSRLASIPCQEKLKRLKNPLRNWNKEKFGVIEQKITEIEREIQKVDELTESGKENDCVRQEAEH